MHATALTIILAYSYYVAIVVRQHTVQLPSLTINLFECYGWLTHPGRQTGHAKHGGRTGRQAPSQPHVTSGIGRIRTDRLLD
jgi:hypothetical protein